MSQATTIAATSTHSSRAVIVSPRARLRTSLVVISSSARFTPRLIEHPGRIASSATFLAVEHARNRDDDHGPRKDDALVLAIQSRRDRA